MDKLDIELNPRLEQWKQHISYKIMSTRLKKFSDDP